MKKTELEMAKEGEFLREHNKKKDGSGKFVVASEALNIGRVKWEAVPMGTNGKGSVAYYMTTEQMYALCHEINNGEFDKKIAADQGTYPSAYKYETGDNASLKLNIGGGKAGCRIQIMNSSVPGANHTIVVSMAAMRTMAYKYMLCTGLIPVVPGSYYASVVAAFEKGREERAKFRKQPTDDEVGDSVDTNNIVDDAAENMARNPVATPNPAEKKKEPKTVDSVEGNYALTVKGSKSIQKGLYVFEATDDNGNAVKLTFRKEEADKYSWFANFENSLAGGEMKELKIRV
jgi:nitrogen fixation protein FixH